MSENKNKNEALILLSHANTILDMASSQEELDKQEAAEDIEEEQATPLKVSKKRKSGRPTVHVHEPTRSFNLVQQQELLTEFVHAEVYLEKAGKKTLLDPANLKSGILMFWEQIAINASESPAFKSLNQKVITTTARAFCEEAVKNKKARMEAGDPHEPPFMETGKGGSDDEDENLTPHLGSAPQVSGGGSKKNILHPAAIKPTTSAAAATAAAKAPIEKPKPSEAVLLISWHIECLLFDHVSKVLEYELAEMSAMASASNGDKKASKRQLNPPAPQADLTTAALDGSKAGSNASSKKPYQESSKKIRASQIEKHFEAQESQGEMNKELVNAMKKPSIEDQTKLATATAAAYVTAIKEGVLEGVKLWKAVPEQPKNYLSSLDSPSLIQAVQGIGRAFTDATTLLEKLAEYGLDGSTFANMKEDEVKDFLKSDCGLSAMHANILVAKLASWRQQLM